VCCAILGAGGVAKAERKRVVVLDFEGPKGDKFHDDLVKLIKKTHTVVPTDKWNGTAEELDASTVSEKNFKKVAKKLKIDAIVEGKIEKRRDEFIIRLKLHEGRSGAQIGSSIDTKAEGPRIDGRAQRDLKDELVDAIGKVESNRMAGGGDDDDARPAKKAARKTDDDDDKPAPKKAARKTDDDDDDKPLVKKAAKKTDDDDDKPARKGFSKHADDERGSERVDKKAAKKTDDDDDAPPAKKAAKKTDDDDDALPAKKTAKKTDDDKPLVKKGAKKADDDDKLPPRKLAKKTDDDDALPAKKGAKKTDDDDALPAKKAAKKTDDDALPVRKAAARKSDDDALPANKLAAKKPDDDKRPKKKVASRDDDAEVDAEAGEPVAADAALSVGERALDAVAGLSLTARQLAFKVRSGLLATPPAYKGAPVAGAMIDATIYPLAVGHKRSDMLKNIGLNVMYDRVLTVNTKDAAGKVYASKESRFGIGGVFRYAFNRSATSPVIMGTLGYSHQLFSISSGTTIGIPSVEYSIFEPGAGFRFPITAKLIAGVDAKLMLIAGAGQIQDPMQYGDVKSVIGFEGAAGVDYLITRSIFARAAFRFETIGITFKGTGMLSNARDGDPTTVDVPGARDNYIGGMATVGYLY
jgi:hypothetical protein